MTQSSLTIVVSATIVACVAIPALWPNAQSGPAELALVTETGPRNYVIDLPSDYTGEEPVPFVMVFGEANSHETARKRIGEEAILVCPSESVASWNVDTPNSADLRFGRQLVDFMSAGYSIDAQQVYVWGVGASEPHAKAFAASTEGAVKVLDPSAAPLGNNPAPGRIAGIARSI